jgi:hypothetical protein
LQQGCTITLNDDPVAVRQFTAWAYPTEYEPRNATFDVTLGTETVQVDITAGLITDRDPERENYGVYVHCNHRLISKELRTRDVGYYITAEAGAAFGCITLPRHRPPARTRKTDAME